MPKLYSARVNDDFQFDELSPTGLDVISIDAKHFHLIKDGKSYQAELIHLDALKKEVSLKINGATYQVKLQDEYDRLIQKMGLQVKAGQQLKGYQGAHAGLGTGYTSGSGPNGKYRRSPADSGSHENGECD